MINPNNMSPQGLDALLQMAGQRLGKDPAQLKNQLQGGDLNGLGIPAHYQQQVGQILNDPKALKQVLENPQVQGMLDKLMKGR